MNSSLPKVLQPLAGKPLLSHVLDGVASLCAERTVVVYGHGGDFVRDTIAPKYPVEWAHQRQQRGTGHAVAQALPFLRQEGTVLVLYGDVPLLSAGTLSNLVQLSRGVDLALLVQKLEDPTGYGRILRDSHGGVVGIQEEKDASPEQRLISETNTGVMAIPASQLGGWLERLRCDNAQGEYYLTDIVAQAVAQGITVATVEPQQEWEALGVNDRIQLAEAERYYQREQARLLMVQGVTVSDPERLTIRGSVNCGRDVYLDVGVVLEGEVHLADGVTVGPYNVLKDCHVGEGTQIQGFCHIEGATIGPLNRVGPYARIRTGTTTAPEVHLGNFVEIKNTQIGSSSKVNHLSYVGDSTVGERVNIGAGTITCNYDGFNKHRTVIEDDVFIGSDTQLVAPVTVSRGSTIGAGSTIVKTTPEDQLSLSRTRQISIPHWKRPAKK